MKKQKKMGTPADLSGRAKHPLSGTRRRFGKAAA